MSLRAFSLSVNNTLKNFFEGFFRPHPQLCLAGVNVPSSALEDATEDLFGSGFWFAVPKRKVSKSRKRMKTTKQYRIPIKSNIVADKRTGEWTLMHKLPFTWKRYIPTLEDYGMQPIDYDSIPRSKTFREILSERKAESLSAIESHSDK